MVQALFQVLVQVLFGQAYLVAEAKRTALKSLTYDSTIVIKPSDKCGSIVVMDRTDYEKACLTHLNNTDFYEEVQSDPNEQYTESVSEEVHHLFDDNFITEFQRDTMLSGDQTPYFYGLPKMHSSYQDYPPMRPISNGHSSCTTKLSEYLDSFLKCAAQKTSSYVRDTSHFLQKLKEVKLTCSTLKQTWLCTLDVNSLYPNIEQQEGADACEEFLETRGTKSIPSNIIKSLILLVLRSHTLNFLGRFFHQVKGTAMETPMAVNFANLFMSKFEKELLSEYKKKFGTGPFMWLRYIDDIFIIWEGSQSTLEHFLAFCNDYSREKSMKSNITFKYSFSQKSVNLLDVTVTLQEDGSLKTDLYCKPTNAHNYLHNSSYHPPHMKLSSPKSQFIRLRRICSSLSDYKKHAKDFVKYFTKRVNLSD